MKIDAVGVASSNLKRTVDFYTQLGFQFPGYKGANNILSQLHRTGRQGS